MIEKKKTPNNGVENIIDINTTQTVASSSHSVSFLITTQSMCRKETAIKLRRPNNLLDLTSETCRDSIHNTPKYSQHSNRMGDALKATLQKVPLGIH